MNCYWIRNSEHELAALRKASRGLAVLPLASIESHGPHLPLGSDTLCAEHLLARIVKRETVAVLPILTYSYVAEARVLPGAIHIPSDILMAEVEAICDEVYRNGFKKILLLHCHGGNVALHWMMARRVLERAKPYALYTLGVFGNIDSGVWKVFETQTGHACEMETSMNMVAAPELVNLKRLGKRTFKTEPGPDVGDVITPVDWISRHPQMAVGVPQKASAAKGEKLFQAWTDAVVKSIRMIKRDKVVPEAMKDYRHRSAAPASTRPRKR
jgi:creatinine amidohydrolase